MIDFHHLEYKFGVLDINNFSSSMLPIYCQILVLAYPIQCNVKCHLQIHCIRKKQVQH